MSQVLYGEAKSLAREAGRELIKESIKERLRERFGDKLAALARIAADELIDDLEANLAIESSIAARREARGATSQKIADALRPDQGRPSATTGAEEGRGARDRGDARASKSPAAPRRSRSSR
jgi:hypothetical protein